MRNGVLAYVTGLAGAYQTPSNNLRNTTWTHRTRRSFAHKPALKLDSPFTGNLHPANRGAKMADCTGPSGGPFWASGIIHVGGFF